jgi:hypothetical protein
VAELGFLLEAIHDAPRAASFSGSARQGHDPRRMQEFVERLNRRPGRSGSVVHLLMQTSRADVEPPTSFSESVIEFWYSEGQGRVDRDGSRTIGVPGKSFHYSPGTGGIVTSDERRRSGPLAQLSPFFEPAVLLGSFKLRIVDTPTHRGRSCWHVATEEIESVRPPIPVWAIAGEEVELWFDQELGIVLRYEGRFDGELISRFEIDDLVVGQPIDPATFAFDTPDGSPVRSQSEMLLERLKSRGVDVTGIDPEDPVQVQEATRSDLSGRHTPVDIEQLAAQHIPKGPPPMDEATARQDIERAWVHMGERSQDGAGLVYVERGENLGPSSEEVQNRFPQFVYEGAGSPPERIKFLGASEAVVWSSHPVIGIREGRAVLVDGKWKVSRATWSGLLAGAGIVCPPPP